MVAGLGWQKSIRRPVVFEGTGVHSGEPSRVTVRPAAPGTGIVLQRAGEPSTAVSLRHDRVGATVLSTCIELGDGAQIATVEHLLAAIAGLGIDNAVIEAEGPEVPVLDGSAAPFVAALSDAGIVRQGALTRMIRVERRVRVEIGEGQAELIPFEGRRFEVEIDFDTAVIGRQRATFDFARHDFARDVAGARTFGFLSEYERLKAAGYAKGASLDNTVVVGGEGVVNGGGLRFADEFVRHKLLDAIGDLALAGAPILGFYRSYRGGHRLNIAVVEALIEDLSAWSWVDGPSVHDWPAVGLGPMLGAAAYGPSVV